MNKDSCSPKDSCYCKAVLSILIIILVWTDPSWANIAITVLAAIMLIGAGNCMCSKKKK